MKPLFTVHGGEYLVGSHIEKHFKRVNVWIPSRDTGIDLLISDRRNCRTVSLQVKFSKDYLPTMKAEFQKKLRACSWFTIDRDKLRRPHADLWVFVLLGFAERTTDFVVVPRRELARRLQSLHGSPKTIRTYLWVTESDRCWETRDLKDKDKRRIVNDEFLDARHDLKKWLNNWHPVAQLNR